MLEQKQHQRQVIAAVKYAVRAPSNGDYVSATADTTGSINISHQVELVARYMLESRNGE